MTSNPTAAYYILHTTINTKPVAVVKATRLWLLIILTPWVAHNYALNLHSGLEVYLLLSNTPTAHSSWEALARRLFQRLYSLHHLTVAWASVWCVKAEISCHETATRDEFGGNMGIYHRAAGDHKHVCFFFTEIKKKHKKDMMASRHAYNPQQPMGFSWLMSLI